MAFILVAEDERYFRNLLQASLEGHGHSVLVAPTGEDALALFDTHPVDLALLDVVMPGLTGFEVCKTIRETSNIPIVMLTALGTPDYMSQALADFGADDYIAKPTTFREIVIRIEALLRRVEWTNNPMVPDEIVVGNVRLSRNPYTLVIDDEEFQLKENQYKLLQILLQSVNKSVMYETLLTKIWGTGRSKKLTLPNVKVNKNQRAKLYNTIHRLRILIGDETTNPKYIHCVPGYGYMFRADHTTEGIPEK
ncbi:response regulator transcription factor [Chloroflexi bacterium TSY]|nr:response regulator transcription factor [Chloroflexi bacterium TSY]